MIVGNLVHPYATDFRERQLVPLLLAAAGIFAAWGLHTGLERLQFAFPWWLDAPSVMTFYGIFYGVFDRYIWRTWLVKPVGFGKLPNLNGSWRGYVISSFDAHGEKRNADIEITQRWSRIRILLRTEESESHSLVASIVIDNANAAILDYEYMSEPRAHAKATMHAHRGTARLTFRKDGDVAVLDGEYYTGRDRQNFGILHFERPREARRHPAT